MVTATVVMMLVTTLGKQLKALLGRYTYTQVVQRSPLYYLCSSGNAVVHETLWMQLR